MENVILREANETEFYKISKQIAIGYKTAYQGLMSEEYLCSLGDNYWVSILNESLANGDSCIIAEQDGEVVGRAVFGKYNMKEYPNDAVLHAIYLSPQYIGHGIGHLLYTEVEKKMLMKGFKFCILEVLSENIRAIEFYNSHGYSKVNSFVVEENGMELSCDTMRKKL